jgi:hypothetical protein
MHARPLPITQALARWPLAAAVAALLAALPSGVAADPISAFDVRGHMQLLVPQASLLTADEREVDEADIRYAKESADPPDIFDGGGWKQRTAVVPDILTGTANTACPLVAGDAGFDAAYSAYEADEAENMRLNTHASLYYDCLTCGTFGDDHYYYDIPRYTDVLNPALPNCGEPGVPCLQGQDFCECAGILKVTYMFGPGCTQSGPIPLSDSHYPTGGRITVHKRDSGGLPLPTSNGDIKATGDIRAGKRTWFLLEDHPGEYFIEIELVVGSDPFRDMFRYQSSQTITGFTCASGREIQVYIPCEDDGGGKDCCERNPLDACCNGGVGGICCPCCDLHPGDPCCDGGVGGVCCDEGDLSGNWQFIGPTPTPPVQRYENMVIYSRTEKVPVIRLDRGEFDNQRLGQVLPPAILPDPCVNNLARFTLRAIHASPFRLDDNDPPMPDETGDYRIASFHVMHDNDLDLLDGQPCGPVAGPPCGEVELIWSASAAGRHDPASEYSTGDMLWDNCVTDPGDMYYTPDAQGDWLHLTGSVLPAEIQTCPTGLASSPCVTPLGTPCPSEERLPFVMQPGTLWGEVELTDEDIAMTSSLDLLEHLDLRTWALSDDGGGNTISGMLSWIHAFGGNDATPACNITAAGTVGVRDRVHTSVPFWPTQGDQGQVQSNLLSVNPSGETLHLNYRLTPAQPGNVSGWYQPYIHLRFFDDPPSWLDYLDGGLDLQPRASGAPLNDHVEPAIAVHQDHHECLGKIEFFFSSDNKDFSTNGGQRPNVLGRLLPPLLLNQNDAFANFNGDICPSDHRLALVNVAVPAGQYNLSPTAWFDGGSKGSPFQDQLSCTVECGKVCRVCLDLRPTCTGMTIVYPAGQPAPLDLACRAHVRADLRVFDCDAPLPPNPPEIAVATICTNDPVLGAGDPTRDAQCVVATGTCHFWVRDEPISLAGSVPCDAPNVSIDLEVQGVGRACPDTTRFCAFVTDPAGNEGPACDAPVDFRDLRPPLITCPPDATLECPACTSPACTGTATATDNCTPTASIVITFSDVVSGTCPQTIARTWTARDLCGNPATCVQTIRVADTTRPVITCPPDRNLQCPACTTPACTGSATATDTCSVPTITFTDVTTGTCPQTIERTWRAVDACQNAATCVQLITVYDATPPVITCPPDATLDCPACTTPACTGTALATDDCSVPVVTFSDVVTGTCPVVTRRTWLATNACGMTASCVQTITVRDITPPVITCPPNKNLECPACTTPACTGTATATDTCSVPTITFTDVVTGTCPQTTTRTWVATDACHNTASCVQTIVVVDNTPPVITCPPDRNLDCPACTTPACTGTATATDTCTPVAQIVITFTDVTTGTCPQTIRRTWVAKDLCLNTASCVQTITLRDITPPVIACPPDKVLECPACTTPACTGTATATDTCTPAAQITITFTDATTGTCPQIITRTWVAKDLCLNTASCVQTITVRDTTPPVITCPPNRNLECPACTTPACTGTASATDTCSVPTVSFSDVSSGTCPKTILRTWRAVDACLNASTCVQTIIVDDNVPPVVTINPTLSACEVGGGGSHCFVIPIATTDPPECGYVTIIPRVTCFCIGRRDPTPIRCVPDPFPGVTFDPVTHILCVPGDKCQAGGPNKQDRRFDIWLRFIDACGNETEVYAGFVWILHDNGRGAPC